MRASAHVVISKTTPVLSSIHQDGPAASSGWEHMQAALKTKLNMFQFVFGNQSCTCGHSGVDDIHTTGMHFQTGGGKFETSGVCATARVVASVTSHDLQSCFDDSCTHNTGLGYPPLCDSALRRMQTSCPRLPELQMKFGQDSLVETVSLFRQIRQEILMRYGACASGGRLLVAIPSADKCCGQTPEPI